MMSLTGTVGEHGQNAIHDVAIVQAMLVIAHRPASLSSAHRPYLRSIHGSADKATKDAIKLFQKDQSALKHGAAGKHGDKLPAPSGVIATGDETWDALVAEMPAQFKYLRALPGSRIVYLEAEASSLQANILAMDALTFEPEFATVVVELMNRIHLLYGIAVSVNDKGARRSFQKQMDTYNDPRHTTGSGPGESNHNFGRAVDLGFKNMRWLQQNGVVVMREGSMLPTMNPREDGSGQARFFWDMLRAEGGAIGMFPGPLGDRPHLQDFDDAIDSAHYLGVLLNRVGEMRWAGYTVDHHRHYECDLGYRGKMFNVGTSIQIWNRRAPVTTKMLNEARAQPSNPTGITAPAVGSDVDKMRDKLRKDFETADTRWTEWTNV